MKILSALVLCGFVVFYLCVGVPQSKAQMALPAFPGAFGYGSQTVGGRGGAIIKVTNVNDSGPGSLREALENNAGPRIVVFDVSGIITLQQNITIHNPFVTVAGQTAPGDGVTLKAGTIDVETHDVVVRGLKFRVGDTAQGQDPASRDGFSISAPWGSTGTQTYNVIVDHNDMAWAVDENAQVWGSDVAGNTDAVKNVTYSWNFIYEGLVNSINPVGEMGMGPLIGDHNSNISMHHNLIAHHKDRSPRVDNIINMEFINNLVYDWGGTPSRIDHQSTANWVNNYYKSGPNSSNRDLKFDDGLDYSLAKFYVEGNYTDAATDRSFDAATAIRNPLSDPHALILQQNNGDVLSWYTASPPVTKSSAPVDALTFNPDNAQSIYDPILDNGGAPQRDAVSTRIVNSVKNRTGQLIDSQNQVGGWPALATYTVKPDADSDGMPDDWENTYGLNVAVNDSAQDPDNDGYTNIEEYINGLITIPGYSSGTPTNGQQFCEEDLNEDGNVNLIDYTILVSDFFKSYPNFANAKSDINNDQKVNLIDYSLLVSKFFQTC